MTILPLHQTLSSKLFSRAPHPHISRAPPPHPRPPPPPIPRRHCWSGRRPRPSPPLRIRLAAGWAARWGARARGPARPPDSPRRGACAASAASAGAFPRRSRLQLERGVGACAGAYAGGCVAMRAPHVGVRALEVLPRLPRAGPCVGVRALGAPSSAR